jgi:GntR family transcriptional regulator/MocR family aminotransferase
MALFISEGHLATHIRRMTRIYRNRRHTLLAELAKRLSGAVTVIPSAAGLHIAVRLGPGIDAERLAASAAGLGVNVRTLQSFIVRVRRHSGLVFGFGATAEPEIAAGVRTLSSALRRRD